MSSATYVNTSYSIVRDVTYPCSSSVPTRHILKFILVIKTSNGMLMMCATIVRKCFETGPKENAKVCLLAWTQRPCNWLLFQYAFYTQMGGLKLFLIEAREEKVCVRELFQVCCRADLCFGVEHVLQFLFRGFDIFLRKWRTFPSRCERRFWKFMKTASLSYYHICKCRNQNVTMHWLAFYLFFFVFVFFRGGLLLGSSDNLFDISSSPQSIFDQTFTEATTQH